MFSFLPVSFLGQQACLVIHTHLCNVSIWVLEHLRKCRGFKPNYSKPRRTSPMGGRDSFSSQFFTCFASEHFGKAHVCGFRETPGLDRLLERSHVGKVARRACQILWWWSGCADHINIWSHYSYLLSRSGQKTPVTRFCSRWKSIWFLSMVLRFPAKFHQNGLNSSIIPTTA